MAGAGVTLRATVEREVPMRYRDGADAAVDRPAYVRAGSGVAWWRGLLAVVQDDASFVALVDPSTGLADAIALPSADGVRQFGNDRGNKRLKPDLEAVLTLPDGRLLAFGSGSTSERERLLLLDLDGVPRWVPAGPLYRALREERAFSGSELNVEGAAVAGDAVRLFQRGNGAVVDGVQPVNATVDLSLDELLAAVERWADGSEAPSPALARVHSYALGDVAGVSVSFTDATPWPSPHAGRVAWLGAAEDSPDTYRDGECVGAALGWIDPDGSVVQAPLRTPDGALYTVKAEGLVFDPGDPTLAWVVCDVDDPSRPSCLCRVRVATG